MKTQCEYKEILTKYIYQVADLYVPVAFHQKH